MLLFLQEWESCFADIIKVTPSPVPSVFYLYAAIAYQASVLLKKANLCPDITYHGLKKITEESGMLVGVAHGLEGRVLSITSSGAGLNFKYVRA